MLYCKKQHKRGDNIVALLSNGITSEKLHIAIKEHINGTKAAVVVTADNEYKEKNYHVPRTVKELAALSLTADYFDFDTQNADELLKYDVFYIIGGNPYYLLNSIRKSKAEAILKHIATEKVLIGISGGALVLTPSISIIDRYSPDMNIVGISDFSGVGVANVHILPHYSKFLNRYENLEKKCKRYEAENRCNVVRLNDGEGILFFDDKQILVKIG